VVDMRITEQLNSGTIYITNDCVRLTLLGKSIADFSGFFRKNFLAKKRLINDSFSDELVNIKDLENIYQSNYLCLK